VSTRSSPIRTPHLGYVEKHSYEAYFGEAFANVWAFYQALASQ
jgi:D-3-phosphoglycerate dehydrogenase / 2-oxoglutarate reductase